MERGRSVVERRTRNRESGKATSVKRFERSNGLDTALYKTFFSIWARSTRGKLVDTTLNETCRLITGCIRPAATPDLYVLSSIAHRK